MKIISDTEAIRHIIDRPGRYACYLGAGASVEAGVMSAQTICERIRDKLATVNPQLDEHDKDRIETWAQDELNWSDTSRRYLTCIRKGYPNVATRVEYFRGLLRESRPCFSHHATALLMSHGYLVQTCLTTNFDHLLEIAFTQQGLSECQAIRSDYECRYWQERPERYYIVKLHGDIDTHNILNTREETIAISESMQGIVEDVVRDSGLVVLGTAGNEKSIRTLFDALAQKAAGVNSILSFGLLWGVYMGPSKPKSLSGEELAKAVKDRIKETEISQDVVEMIGDSGNELFCFFPVWGASKFMYDLVQATADKELRGTAARHLDHEMRLRHVFTSAGLSEDSVTRHLASLREQRRAILARSRSAPQEEEVVVTTTLPRSRLELRVMYGDITSRSLMGRDEAGSCRSAVVSAEDTCISAGGGVAYQLLNKAGPELILNELAKFAPIEKGTVAVTSGGNLPAHYIFHAAALEIGEGAAYSVSKEGVRTTTRAVLEKATALELGLVWVPLLGAGVASLQPQQSFEGILEAIRDWDRVHEWRQDDQELVVAVVIYRERELPRNEVRVCIEAILAGSLASTATTG